MKYYTHMHILHATDNSLAKHWSNVWVIGKALNYIIIEMQIK